MANTIAEIDRIRAIDVPWKLYLGAFIFLSTVVCILAWLFSSYVRFDIGYVVLTAALFIFAMLVIFSTITYLGIKEEEIRDCKTLAKLYNRVKKTRDHQLNQCRLLFKLENMNKCRNTKEVDIQFLRVWNMVRVQSNHLAHAHWHKESTDRLQNEFYYLQERVNEAVFFNGIFGARLNHQISSLEDFNAITDDAGRLAIIREAFSTHIVLHLFSKNLLDDELVKLTPIQTSNAQRTYQKTHALLSDNGFQQLIARASGCSVDRVVSAFSTSISENEERLTLVEAHQEIHAALYEKLPTRNYEKANSGEDIVEDKSLQESWSLN